MLDFAIYLRSSLLFEHLSQQKGVFLYFLTAYSNTVRPSTLTSTFQFGPQATLTLDFNSVSGYFA
jgi:hypothetical protein